MIISSEQEMLDFGTAFAESLNKSSASTGARNTFSEDRKLGRAPLSMSSEKVFGQAPSKKTAMVIELVGDVGTGKTTFTRGLAKGLGIKEPVTSPSFTISKSYAIPSGGNLIHYDFYRLSDPGLMAEDLEESLGTPSNIVVIEWGDSIANILPKNHTKITIRYTSEGREITL